MSLLLWGRSGCRLLNPPANAVVVVKTKHSMLPLLVVLFLISYGLMCLLVVEQDRTIQAQRGLIKQLFTDSTQLSAIKNQAIQKQHAEAQAQAEAQARSQAQTPSTQVNPRDKTKNQSKADKLRRPAPQKPPQAAADEADERRVLISI